MGLAEEMMDPIVLLALAVLLLSLALVLALASVPALWWLYVRQAARVDELKRDTEALDLLTGRVCERVGLGEVKP